MLKKWLWLVLFLLVILVGCDLIYGLLYIEFTLIVVNNTSQDITEINISKGSSIETTDTSVIASSQAREYKVEERTTYSVDGIMGDGSTFSEKADFLNKEEIRIKVE